MSGKLIELTTAFEHTIGQPLSEVAEAHIARYLIIACTAGLMLYASVMWDVFDAARSQVYFEAHPDELRIALDACRSGWFWWPECDSAEAAATH